MAESESQDAGTGAAGMPEGSDFQIRKLYVKDISFESPAAPEIFTRQWQPTIELQLHTDAKRFTASEYEVTLTGTVTGKADEETAFLAEVQIAGIFTITGVTDEELGPLLGSFCPGVLFPYLREVMSDLSVRGGFPQVVLAPVNFDSLLAEHLTPAPDSDVDSNGSDLPAS